MSSNSSSLPLAFSKGGKNNACHFCQHAARRPGRQKTALLVSCSAPACRQVYCSRPACIKKLGLGDEFCDEEVFREWRDRVETGKQSFVCPHCANESSCPGPQCARRQSKRKLGSSSPQRSSASAIRVDIEAANRSAAPPSKSSVTSAAESSPLSSASSTASSRRSRPALHVKTEFTSPEIESAKLPQFDPTRPLSMQEISEATERVISQAQAFLLNGSTPTAATPTPTSNSAPSSASPSGLAIPPYSRTRSGVSNVKRDLDNALALIHRSLKSSRLSSDWKVRFESQRQTLESLLMIAQNRTSLSSPYPLQSNYSSKLATSSASSNASASSLLSPTIGSHQFSSSSTPAYYYPITASSNSSIAPSPVSILSPQTFAKIPSPSPLATRRHTTGAGAGLSLNLPTSIPGSTPAFTWDTSPSLDTPLAGPPTKRTRHSNAAANPSTPSQSG